MTGKKVLELGPLEGGHTYMFLKAGAQSVLGLEANTRCYLKCLVVKEALLLDNAHFLFGNFVPWLQENKLAFDFVHASGVLYHMVDPIELLDLLCTTSTQLYLWTHYADLDAMPTTDPRYIAGIIGVETSYAHGREYKLYRRHYQGSPTTDPKFCGGVHKNPAWLEKSMILHVLHQYGFSTTIEHDVAGHANGPCFSVLATKS